MGSLVVKIAVCFVHRNLTRTSAISEEPGTTFHKEMKNKQTKILGPTTSQERFSQITHLLKLS